MDDALRGEIDYLLNERVWKTKKSRMEAESRLKQNNILSDILINYYTFALIAFSIWTLVLGSGSSKTEHITISTLILSIGLFGITLFLSSIGFKQKAAQFKDCYHKLDSLESDIKYLLRSAEFKSKQQVIEEFNVLEKRYIEILALTDNHDSIDFEKIVIMKKLKELTFVLRCKFYAKIIMKWFIIGVLVIFPILLVFLV